MLITNIYDHFHDGHDDDDDDGDDDGVGRPVSIRRFAGATSARHSIWWWISALCNPHHVLFIQRGDQRAVHHHYRWDTTHAQLCTLQHSIWTINFSPIIWWWIKSRHYTEGLCIITMQLCTITMHFSPNLMVGQRNIQPGHYALSQGGHKGVITTTMHYSIWIILFSKHNATVLQYADARLTRPWTMVTPIQKCILVQI